MDNENVNDGIFKYNKYCLKLYCRTNDCFAMEKFNNKFEFFYSISILTIKIYFLKH